MKKDTSRAVLFGVCSGIAKKLDIDPLWIRLAFIIAFLHLGIGILAYIILALIMEKD